MLLLLSWSFVATPVEAAVCRYLDGQQICILQIKRSAKYHWEYRTIISIDGIKRPREVYNCRDRYYVKSDRTIIQFKSAGIGNLICSLVQK